MNNLKHLKASHVLKRVEPPHWWAGMYIKKFQLLFYGDHISEYTITCSSDLNILQVEKTQNSNYLFVTLDTSEIQAGMYSFSFQKEIFLNLQFPMRLNQELKIQQTEQVLIVLMYFTF